MYAILISLHILISIGLIIVVLLQSSKGEGLAGAFGGSGITGAVFGGRGAATFLSKATTVLAIAFFFSCMVLTFITPTTGGRSVKSTIQEEARKEATGGTMPATGIPTPAPEQQTGKTELPPGPEQPPEKK